MNTESNPYSVPAAPLQDAVAPVAAPAMWNPNAAASWSLLFSPVFGGYLQMRNWQELGEPEKAKQSWYWVLGSGIVIVAVIAATLVLPDTHWFQTASNRSGLILLLAWYFAHGKQQVAYVKERYGKDYPRKGWGLPLGIAIMAIIGLMVVAIVATMALAMAGVVQLPA